MTLQQIEQMMEDTRRSSRVDDRMTQTTALALLEIARQLTILNDRAEAQTAAPTGKGKAAGKK